MRQENCLIYDQGLLLSACVKSYCLLKLAGDKMLCMKAKILDVLHCQYMAVCASVCLYQMKSDQTPLSTSDTAACLSIFTM